MWAFFLVEGSIGGLLFTENLGSNRRRVHEVKLLSYPEIGVVFFLLHHFRTIWLAIWNESKMAADLGHFIVYVPFDEWLLTVEGTSVWEKTWKEDEWRRRRKKSELDSGTFGTRNIYIYTYLYLFFSFSSYWMEMRCHCRGSFACETAPRNEW